MQRLCTFFAVVCLVGAGTPLAHAKDEAKAGNKEKIIGSWTVIKGPEGSAGSVMEFTKERKVLLTVKVEGKEIKLESTYMIDGDKLTILSKNRQGKEVPHVDAIKSIGDKQAFLTDPTGVEIELKRK